MAVHKRKSSLLLVDADDRITSDVLCVKCGYSLRSRLVSDRCPNCNHPASDSVHGDYLIHADRPIIVGLVDAARLVEYGMLVLGGLMGLALLAALLSLLSNQELNAFVDRVHGVVFAAAVISPVVATMGVITLTTRHTAAYYWVRYGNPRTYLQAGLGLALGIALIVLAYRYFGGAALQISLIVWFLIPGGAFLRGIESLARRVPNKQLASFARATFVGLMGFGILSAVVVLLGYWAWKDESWRDSHLAFSAISAIGGVALGIAVYLLIVRVRRNLTSLMR